MSQAEPQPEPAPVEKEVVESIELEVLFDFDKAVIKSVYEPQFQQIAQTMRDDPELITTIIEGHTDWIGTDEIADRSAGMLHRPVSCSGRMSA